MHPILENWPEWANQIVRFSSNNAWFYTNESILYCNGWDNRGQVKSIVSDTSFLPDIDWRESKMTKAEVEAHLKKVDALKQSQSFVGGRGYGKTMAMQAVAEYDKAKAQDKHHETIWDYAPEYANYLSVDGDGMAFFYNRRPEKSSFGNFWQLNSADTYDGVDYQGPSHLLPDVPWQESLQVRPTKNEITLGKEPKYNGEKITGIVEQKPKQWPDDYEFVQSAIYNLYGGRTFRTMEPGEGWEKSEALLLDTILLDPASIKELKSLGFTVSCLQSYKKFIWRRKQRERYEFNTVQPQVPCVSENAAHRALVLAMWPGGQEDAD